MIWNGMAEASNMETLSPRGGEFSAHNFEHANTEMLAREFEDGGTGCQLLLGAHLSLPAYDHVSKRHTGSTQGYARRNQRDRTPSLYCARAGACQRLL